MAAPVGELRLVIESGHTRFVVHARAPRGDLCEQDFIDAVPALAVDLQESIARVEKRKAVFAQEVKR